MTDVDPVELAALLGQEGVAQLAARCRQAVRQARLDGVTLRPSLRCAVEFVESLADTLPVATRVATRAPSSCWIGTREAARRAGTTRRTIQRHAHRGELIARRCGPKRRTLEVDADSLDQFVASRQC
jgi:excisionase family DNA binding protein